LLIWSAPTCDDPSLGDLDELSVGAVRTTDADGNTGASTITVFESARPHVFVRGAASGAVQIW
jgi:hypothetical protein